MQYKERVPEQLFKEAHYLGRPADFTDKIITRRVRLIEQVEGFVSTGCEVLEIGCGNGATIFLLADKMKYCLGIDVEAAHSEEFEKYKRTHKIENCEFRLFDIEKQELEKQFDRLISFEVIEHLTDDRNVKHYYDALKPGGMAVFSVPNKWWIFETHGAKLPLLPWNRVPFFSWLPTPIHEKFANARIYTKARIKTLLENAGFRIERMEYITAPMDVLKEGALKSFLIKYLFNTDTTTVPFLSTSIFIVASKK